MKKIAIILISSLSILLFVFFNNSPNSKLQIHFLNVGQGDAILICTPIYGHNILIDGGPDESVITEIEKHIPYFDKNIDLIILTHPHADHLTGLIKVLEEFHVQNALITGVINKDMSYEHFINTLNGKNINIYFANSNNDIKLGEITLDIIYPDKYIIMHNPDNSNNTSIAIRITHNGKSILLTGDSEIEQEKEMLIAGQTIRANIFKAAHHGSKTGIYHSFLKSVNPKKVIIQSGAGNRFDHPHKEALQAFESLKSAIYRNDLSGSINLEIP